MTSDDVSNKTEAAPGVEPIDMKLEGHAGTRRVPALPPPLDPRS